MVAGAGCLWGRGHDQGGGGERYLPRLEDQTDNEYLAYKARASIFNATARPAHGLLMCLLLWGAICPGQGHFILSQ